MTPGAGMRRLAAELAGHGPLLSQALRPPRDGEPVAWSPGPRAAAGPRTSARASEYELLVDTIYEGHLLHAQGHGRVVFPGEPDLALLLGDQLYAIGLSSLAELGDLEAVAELADVISLGARAQAVADPELARATWEGAAAAVGFGASPAHRAAKAAARAGQPEAAAALRAAAEEAAAGPV